MSHYHEQFLKQKSVSRPGRVTRFCTKAAIPLRISWNGGQLISKILAITPDKLVLDFGSQAEDNIAVLKAQHITITAETQGAKVEFTVEQLQQSEYLQLPGIYYRTASHLMVCTTTPIFPHHRPTPSALFLPDQTGG